jgi:hypothetical protein
MGLRGLAATLTVEGAVNALCFDAYAERVLGPSLRRGDVVVLDNLGAHKASRIEEVAAGRGAQVLWLSVVLARLLARRAVLVKDQDGVTCGEGAHARRAGEGISACHQSDYES